MALIQPVTPLRGGASKPLALDVGAGTGKFTAQLAEAGWDAVALDPSADMLTTLRDRHPTLASVRAAAEELPVRDRSIDLISCAQAWHWFDHASAGREFSRVLTPEGRVLLAWNTIDVRADPWVLRLSRIMHSGDVMREGFLPELPPGWRIEDEARVRWTDRLAAADLFRLTATRSYWLRSSDQARSRVRANLEWYLFEHSGLRRGSRIRLPYRTDAFLVRPGSPGQP